jgi:NhaP-type Na+/H+ or K+/H+ antiporter/Trk K+ transport system NAD-binding subunit
MHWPIDLDSPTLTLALALAAGMLAQVVARHLRLPGIVLLLGAGVLLGPDGLDVVRPDRLGDVLVLLIGFAVAVILFEGGMNLDIKRLRRSATSIRRLNTVGALVTWVGGALAARWFMHWPWRLAILFGSLVIVTGPTVINPLLRRLRVKSRVATILEAEGVLIDAIGAITAVVALEVALSGGGIGRGLGDVALRLAFGGLVGVAFGLMTSGLLKLHWLVPEGLENILILSLVLVAFHVCNALLGESGLIAVTLAGLVVGNIKVRALEDLREFKEQLTTLLIGLLFVLLAADVRVAEVVGLGWGGVATVGALMCVVRPVNVAVSTLGTDLTLRERAFLSWMAPRGIVAAAVASLFAEELADHGVAEASQLRALVFLVIAVTVLVQGLTGAPLARRLGLRRPSGRGYVIFGASALGLALARLLRSDKHEVLLLDGNPRACQRAEDEGFRVLFGNAVSETVLLRAQLDSRAGCIAVTSNEEVNFLFARRAREEFGAPRAWLALRREHISVENDLLDKIGAEILFGQPTSLDAWSQRLDRADAVVETWAAGRELEAPALDPGDDGDPRDLVLPLAGHRGAETRVFDRSTRLAPGDALSLVIRQNRRAEAEAWLRARGLERVAP